MEISEKIAYWKNLFRSDKEQADKYYYENIFPEVIDHFCSKRRELSKFRYLISLLGFSPQPVILFIRAVNPEKVLFIYSEETESLLDTVHKWTDLKMSQVSKEVVRSSDPTEVYKAIKNFVNKKAPKEVLLDITGGKKAMVGGAAMAGSLLGVVIGYVDYEKYLEDLRQPEPGTEYPNLLKNPYYVLGDLDLEKAKEAFNQCNFGRCLEILNVLEDRVEDIWGIRKLKQLAKIYRLIDAFNFSEALNLLESYLVKYQDDKRWIPMDRITPMRDILKILINQDHPDYNYYACLNTYFSAERFAGRSRYDIAVFLMYRTIEMVLSSVLKGLGIDPSRPVYPDWIDERKFNDELQEVFEKDYSEKKLPEKVGLMDSAIILAIKRDPIMEELDLKELRGIIALRNESIFTHGFRPLKEEDFKKIRRTTRKLLEKYLSLISKPSVKDSEYLFNFPKLIIVL